MGAHICGYCHCVPCECKDTVDSKLTTTLEDRIKDLEKMTEIQNRINDSILDTMKTTNDTLQKLTDLYQELQSSNFHTSKPEKFLN